MITEKEKIILDENYEISKKIYNLFKKYRNYTNENANSRVVDNNKAFQYNYDDLFKKNIVKTQQAEIKENTDNISLIPYKENIFTRFYNRIKRIFKVKKF